MRTRRDQASAAVLGFSLVELMVVVVMVTLVLAAILGQLWQVQQRAQAEQGKVDDFQQARDFLDQIFRDSRQMGFPNVHNFDTSQTPPVNACTTSTTWLTVVVSGQTSYMNDCRMAVGLVKLKPTQLVFEGDVDGSGRVSVVSYAVNGNGNCATCIQRAQVFKISADNVTGQSNLTAGSYSVEVQNVQNPTAIFTAYDVNGNSVNITAGIDIDNNPTIIDTVRTIQIQLKIASASAIDPKTGQQLEADIEGRVQVANCSMATTGLALYNGVQITCQ